jgi:DNA-binding NarL/FixJ family response regulator
MPPSGLRAVEFCTDSHVLGQGAKDQIGDCNYLRKLWLLDSMRGWIMDFSQTETDHNRLGRPAPDKSSEMAEPMDGLSASRARQKMANSEKTAIAIIAENTFFRSCLTRCLEKDGAEFIVAAYENFDAWRRDHVQGRPSILLLCASGERATDAIIHEGQQAIDETTLGGGVIVISDVEEPALMIAALERGAKGYVPMSLDLEVVISAIKLVHVGGTFVPASSLLAIRQTKAEGVHAAARKTALDILTERQLNVLEILRRGDPNKIIAHKLNMSEATVKIHVRNMMKKTHARNRTELVCMTSDLF